MCNQVKFLTKRLLLVCLFVEVDLAIMKEGKRECGIEEMGGNAMRTFGDVSDMRIVFCARYVVSCWVDESER